MNFIKRVFKERPKTVKSIEQAVKFGFVGVLNTAVGWLSFFVLFYLLHIEFRIANALSYLFGLINSFFFNKLWTFKSKEYKVSEVVWFIVVFLVAFSLQYYVSVFLKERLKFYPMIAYVIGNIIYTVIGFVGNKLITFRE